MRKPIFLRILLLTLVYCGVILLLISAQFSKRGGFTQRAGNLLVTGQYRSAGENDPPLGQNEYFLDGEAHVFFGGIDFSMGKGDGDSLMLSGENETTEKTLPERMIVSGDSVRFIFSGGTELEFITQYSGGALEMQVSGVFPEGVSVAELPFKPLRRTVIRDTDGQLTVTADGLEYTFGLSPIDPSRRILLIRAGEGPLAYRAIPDRKNFSYNDFILTQAATAEPYNEYLTKWRDQNFSYWNRTISEQNNEDLVIAYCTEALARGSYKAAVAAVSPAFLRGENRTYESTVYLGSLEQMYRSLVNRDREKISRLSRQINEKSLDFLKEPRVFEYFAARGQNSLVDAGAELVRSIDPAILALDISPGILEGFVDWNYYRPNTENPFERLVDQACFVVFESLRKTNANESAAAGSRVFSFSGNEGDTEFNLRLGKALLVYAEKMSNASFEGIGRSLIVSALSMGEASGEARSGLAISSNGQIVEQPVRAGLTTARLYRILYPLSNYPRAAIVSSLPNHIWAWTVAQTVSSTQQGDVLDLAIRFPAGESHYMIIRGIRPFARLQLYNMDFRSDSQFERYDSSGWAYYPQDQVLVLKMRHRTTEEHVRIIFQDNSRPADPPASAPPAAAPPAPAAVTPTPVAPAPVVAPAAATPPVIVPPIVLPPPAATNSAPETAAREEAAE